MSREKQRSNVKDMSKPKHQWICRICWADRSVWGGAPVSRSQIYIAQKLCYRQKVSKFFQIFQENEGFSTQGQVFIRKDREVGEI
jgi:hypothetical protein